MEPLRPFTTAELTQRLRRPGDRTDETDHRPPSRRRPIGAQSAAAVAAMSAAAGGGGGGGSHGGGLGEIGVSVVDRYPYWLDEFADGATTGWTADQGVWSESGGQYSMTSGTGISGWRGVSTFDASVGVADIEAFCELGSGTLANMAIGARMTNSAAPFGYFTLYTGTQIRLVKGDGLGSYTLLDSVAASLTNGDEIGIRCRGSLIQATANGLTVLTAIDATRTSGYCGLAVFVNAVRNYARWGTR